MNVETAETLFTNVFAGVQPTFAAVASAVIVGDGVAKITNVSAKTGWDTVKQTWDAGGPGKLEVGVFDLGLNPAIAATASYEPFSAAGILTFVPGNHQWAGGTNKEPVGLTLMLTGSTVTLDEKPLVTTGALVAPPAAPAK